MLPFGRGHYECAAPTVTPRFSSLTGSALRQLGDVDGYARAVPRRQMRSML